MPKKLKKLKVWQHGNRKLIVTLIGLCLCTIGVFCGIAWEDLFNMILKKELTLRPDSKLYENWKEPPMDLNLDIYMFNWTNAEEFGNFSSKPTFEQLGPYRFREQPAKVDIAWHPHNSTVTYRKRSYFYFDADGSNGSLSDEIVTLNAVALSAGSKAKQWSSMRRAVVDVGLKLYNQEMHVRKSVDEMLFTGYQDNMIDIARTMPIFGNDVEVPFDRFGWFYTRNGSKELLGTFNVFTGVDDVSLRGQLYSWNYVTHTGYFDSYCGMTNGSAGEFQPPDLRVGGSVSLFTPDLCRSVPLDYVGNETVEGVLGYKYSGGPRSIDNGTMYPENKCFCGGECVPSGVMNITACRFGSPVFVSYPHFYHADPYYVEQVDGLAPERERHEFFMTVEPQTGLPLEVAARIQVNMLVEPIASVELYEDIPRVFFPLIWFEQKVRITPKLAANLKNVGLAVIAGQIIAGLCVAFGVVLLLWYPVNYFIDGRRRRHRIASMNGHGHGHVMDGIMAAGAESRYKKPTTNGATDVPLLENVEKKAVISNNTPSVNSNDAQ